MPKTRIRRKKYFKRFLHRSLPLIKALGVITLISLVIGSLIYVALETDVFKIKSVGVFGSESFVNAVDVQKLAEENTLGKVIFLLDKSSIEAALIRNFRGAKDIQVKIKLPDKLLISVFEREPLALVFNEDKPDFFIIDSEGYVLGVVDETKTNLPKVRYEGIIEVGNFIDEKLVPVYLDLMMSLDKNEVKASSVSFYSRYVRLYTQEGVEVLIGNDKDKMESLWVVKNLIKQESLEKTIPNKIDLRYDKVSVQ